jgi:hypothetical protein
MLFILQGIDGKFVKFVKKELIVESQQLQAEGGSKRAIHQRQPSTTLPIVEKKIINTYDLDFDSSIKIITPLKDLVGKIGELGVLLRHIRTFVDSVKNAQAKMSNPSSDVDSVRSSLNNDPEVSTGATSSPSLTTQVNLEGKVWRSFI